MIGEVRPGAEVPALRAEDDRAAVPVFVEGLERVREGTYERQVEVVVGRAVELDGGDESVARADGDVTEPAGCPHDAIRIGLVESSGT